MTMTPAGNDLGNLLASQVTDDRALEVMAAHAADLMRRGFDPDGSTLVRYLERRFNVTGGVTRDHHWHLLAVEALLAAAELVEG